MSELPAMTTDQPTGNANRRRPMHSWQQQRQLAMLLIAIIFVNSSTLTQLSIKCNAMRSRQTECKSQKSKKRKNKKFRKCCQRCCEGKIETSVVVVAFAGIKHTYIDTQENGTWHSSLCCGLCAASLVTRRHSRLSNCRLTLASDCSCDRMHFFFAFLLAYLLLFVCFKNQRIKFSFEFCQFVLAIILSFNFLFILTFVIST